MSAQGFKSVFMAGGIAAAALGCYLVSLRVASERAALENVENKIVLAQREIRLINTEIGTRGRLAQLERWNVKVIRLSAPSADQFVQDSFQLATLAKPDRKPAVDAPIVYASAPAAPRHDPIVTNDDGSDAAPRPSTALSDMIHVASYTRPAPKPTRLAAALPPAVAATHAAALVPKPKAKLAIAAKPVKTAMADPLGPLSAAKLKAKSELATTHRTATNFAKDPGSRQ